jgi:NAD(P)-dependent dehydrogenase (short-subunit alcohol dehydrogenase family)
MARRPVVLVTGAGGEMGHGLIHEIAARRTFGILARDVRPLDPGLAGRCAAVPTGDILDAHLLERVRAEFEIAEAWGRPSEKTLSCCFV